MCVLGHLNAHELHNFLHIVNQSVNLKNPVEQVTFKCPNTYFIPMDVLCT